MIKTFTQTDHLLTTKRARSGEKNGALGIPIGLEKNHENLRNLFKSDENVCDLVKMTVLSQ